MAKCKKGPESLEIGSPEWNEAMKEKQQRQVEADARAEQQRIEHELAENIAAADALNADLEEHTGPAKAPPRPSGKRRL